MSVKHVRGDLIKMALNGQFDMIVHGCNCYCTMGGGIAAIVALHFPNAAAADQRTVRGANKTGTFTIASEIVHHGIHPRKLLIVNAYTQFGLSNGEKDVFEYEAFDSILTQLRSFASHQHVAFPWIGAGLACGDWQRIRTMIEHRMGDMNVTIVEYAK